MRRQLNRLALVVATILIIVLAFTALATRRADAPDLGVLVPVAGALPVQVERIVDGDTLDVRSAETSIRVRLYGVNTPERGEACFAEATDRLTVLAGEVVQLLPDARLQDPFDRELRYVYTEDGVLIDEALVREGYGLAWRDDGSKRDAIIAAEEEARAAGRGCLWADN
ncbi:MAG: thermonuclease family protein [Dehalococcoidia bacterium]|nr:thermonuclease family protein [Dehalococcoidia bacterium]